MDVTDAADETGFQPGRTHCSILAAALQREPHAERDAGLLMCLKPTSRARQESPVSAPITTREFPLTETLVITVYSGAVTTLCRLHL